MGVEKSDMRAEVPFNHILKFEADPEEWIFRFSFKDGSPYQKHYPDGLVITHESVKETERLAAEEHGLPLTNKGFVGLWRMQEMRFEQCEKRQKAYSAKPQF